MFPSHSCSGQGTEGDSVALQQTAGQSLVKGREGIPHTNTGYWPLVMAPLKGH